MVDELLQPWGVGRQTIATRQRHWPALTSPASSEDRGMEILGNTKKGARDPTRACSGLAQRAGPKELAVVHLGTKSVLL